MEVPPAAWSTREGSGIDPTHSPDVGSQPDVGQPTYPVERKNIHLDGLIPPETDGEDKGVAEASLKRMGPWGTLSPAPLGFTAFCLLQQLED